MFAITRSKHKVQTIALSFAALFHTACVTAPPKPGNKVDGSVDAGTGDASAEPSANPSLTTRTTDTAPARSATQTTRSSATPPGVDAGDSGGVDTTDASPNSSGSDEPLDGGTDTSEDSSTGPGGSTTAPSNTGSTAAPPTSTVPLAGPPPIDQSVPDDPARAAAGSLLLQVTAANGSAIVNGRNLVFIAVGNTSNDDIENVTVVFTVPTGMAFNGVNDAAPDAACWNNNCAASVEATWSLGTIGAGETRTLEANVLVTADVADGDTIAAHVVANAPGQSTLAVDKSFPVTTAEPEAELALTSEADPLLPGETTEWNVDIGQIGDLPLLDAVVTLALPRGVEPEGPIAHGGVFDDGVVTWELSDIDIGQTLRRSIRVTIDPDAAPGNVYNPIAQLTYTTEAEATLVSQLPLSIIEERAPLTLQVSSDQAPGGAGGRLRYFATVSNTGTRTLEATSLWFREPAEMGNNGVSDAVPDQSCWNNNCGSTLEANWVLGSIEPGETLMFEVTPTVANTVTDGHLLTTYFSLFAAEGGYVRSSQAVPVNAAAQAQLHMGASDSPVIPGSSYTYVLDIGQVGNSALQNTTLTLQLPREVEIDSISDGGLDEGGGIVTWQVGTVAVAAAAKRSIQVNVPADISPATVLKARSKLTFDGGNEVDATSEDLVAVVEAAPPLSISLQLIPEGETSAPSNPVAVPSGRLLLRATITNTSARSIEDVTLEYRMPKSLSFNGVNDATPNAACWNNNCGETIESVFNLGTFAAGQALIVDANTLVAADAFPGTLMVIEPRVWATGVTQHVFVQQTLPVGN